MFDWLKKLTAGRDRKSKTPEPGMIIRTCRICGKTFTFPSNAGNWPKYCPECRKKRAAGFRRIRRRA